MFRTASLIAVFALVGASIGAPSALRAEVKPTLKDRVEQIVATFMGDPAANVDIDMKHVLDQWRSMKPKLFEELSAEDARRQPTPIEAAAELLKAQGASLDRFQIETKDVTIPGPDGPLKTRIYIPAGKADTGRPVVVFLHGGGFVLENGAGTEASARAIAGESGFLVVAPDYRLAPEHKFPAAPNDTFAAYKWVTENAASFGGDPRRIALAGEGAGGMLAVDTAIAARDAKLTKPIALVLVTPAGGIDLKTNSWLEDSTARPWNKAAVEWALRQYLPTPDTKDDPRVDLIGKADVDGLPPTTIVTAEDDPLRSDGERLGGKLKRATVPVDMRDYPGVTHDFFGMGAAVAKAAQAEAFVAANLKAAISPRPDDSLMVEQPDLGTSAEAIDPHVTSPGTAVLQPEPAGRGETSDSKPPPR